MTASLTPGKLVTLLLLVFFTGFVKRSYAQTAISATGAAPDASAMFEVVATDKGMLVPRIALTQTTLSAPVTSPLTSLLVYNTSAVNDVTPGYYYWNGTSWQRLMNGNGSVITGSGTPNYLARWITGSTLGIGVTYDNGTNVGINTTVPGGKLEVVGGPVTLSSAYLDINRDAFVQNGISWYSQGYPSWSRYMSPGTQTATGPHADLTAPQGFFVTSWAMRDYIENAAGYGWTFESAANTTTPTVKFEIRASDGLFHSYGNGIVDGSVGIGTTSPGARLHVNAGDASLALFGPNTTWGGRLYVGASPNQAVAATAQVISTDGNLHLDPAPSKNMYLGYYQARDIYINTNGGNVGIGNAGPGAKLHVSGGGQILGTNGTSSTTRTLTILEDGDAQINFGSYPGAWSPALQIQDNTTNRYVWISPLDNGSGGNARLVTGGSDFAIMPSNVLASTFSASGDVTTARYHFAQYVNTSDNAVGSGVSGVMVKAGDNYFRTGNAAAVSTFLNSTIAPTYANLTGIPVRTAWSGVHRNFVAEQLSWKNYGNSHTIFDASQGTSPDGTAVSNTNAQVAWSPTYPTLMGWNGSNTYGVRVDYARYAETVGTGDNLGNHVATTTLNMNSQVISNAAEVYTHGWFRNNNANVGLYNQAYGNHFYASSSAYWSIGGGNGTNTGIIFRNGHQGAIQGYVYSDGSGFGLLHSSGGWAIRTTPSVTEAYNTFYAATSYQAFIYDRDNGAYYLDPNSVTNINDLRFQYVPCIGGYCPPNYAIRLTPNLHLNSNSGHAVILNWDNGGYQGGAQVFRVGRGDGNDNFYVCGDGTTHASLWGSGQMYVGWNWAYQYGYSCSYACGWWNYSTCYSTCYDYYNKFQVNGRAYSYSWANFSDGRLKTNVGTIDNALSMVTAMRGVTYDWKTNGGSREEVIKNADPEFTPLEDIKAAGLRSRVGFIAQEIQAILPSAVSEIEEKDASGKVIGTTLGVDYITIIPVLVEAIKEQQKQIDELRTMLGLSTSAASAQQTNYNNAPEGGALTMSAGKSNSNNLSPKEAVKLLEDNLKFMTKEHQDQMKEFINEIKAADKLTPDQLSKVLEFRNNIQEFQKSQQK